MLSYSQPSVLVDGELAVLDSLTLQQLEADAERALPLANAYLAQAKRQNKSRLLGRGHWLIAESLYQLDSFNQALLHYQQSRSAYAQVLPSTAREMAINHASEAFIYLYKLQFFESAIASIRKALPFAESVQDTLLMGDLFSNLGSSFFQSNTLDSSAYYFDKAYQLDLKVGDTSRLTSDLISDDYMCTGKIQPKV